MNLGLPFQVESEDGQTYTIDAFEASLERIQRLWDHFGRHRVLFCDQMHGDFDAFVNMILSRNTVVLTVDDVGIVYATGVVPGYSAEAHFFFWDLVSRGRHRVILQAVKWGMDQFDLHRMDMLVPKHAYAALHRIYHIGFRLEGLKRRAQLFDGQWHDMLEFGILREELTDEALRTGKLERVEAERGWFGLLGKDVKLMNYIMRRPE